MPKTQEKFRKTQVFANSELEIVVEKRPKKSLLSYNYYKRNARSLPGVINNYAKAKILHHLYCAFSESYAQKTMEHWKHHFSMEILRTHEYDISLVRGGHWEGPHVFGFLIHAFPL